MARGKHGKAASGRRSHANLARLAQLRAELEQEQVALEEAENAARAVEAVIDATSRESGVRDRELAGLESSLAAEVGELEEVGREAAKIRKAVHQAWTRLVDRYLDERAGGREGFEELLSAIGVGGYLIDSPTKRLTTEQATRLQKIRGDRRKLAPEEGPTPSMAVAVSPLMRRVRLSHLPDGWQDLDRGNLEPDTKAAIADLEKFAEVLYRRTPTSIDIDSLHAWHPPFAVAPDYRAGTDLGQVLPGLGVLPTVSGVAKYPEKPDAWPAPTSSISAATRTRLAGDGPEQLVTAWSDNLRLGELTNTALGRQHSDLAAGPLHPRPGRTASLRHLYTKAAIGAWSHLVDRGIDAESNGLAAIGLAVAAGYWLPGDQAFAFADSEPLAEADVDEIRLPFPQAFLAFADPLVLRPSDSASEPELEQLRALDAATDFLLRSKEPLSLRRYQGDLAAEPGLLEALPLSLDRVLAIRGCKIEGLLLMADSLGRLDDLFAWCVQIPSGIRGTLGRHVIPARISQSSAP